MALHLRDTPARLSKSRAGTNLHKRREEMPSLKEIRDRAKRQHDREHNQRESAHETAKRQVKEEFENRLQTEKNNHLELAKNDLPFWLEAIEKAVSVGEFYVSNKSFPQEHRHCHTYYAEALQNLFGAPFRASSSGDYTSVHWSPTKHYPALRGN